MLTTYCTRHSKADVNRLYIKRRRESFRLINVEVNVGMEMRYFDNYLMSPKEEFLREKFLRTKHQAKELKKKKAFIRSIKVVMKAKLPMGDSKE